MVAVKVSSLVEALSGAIGEENVRGEDFILESYTQDNTGLLFPSERPAAVVMPSSTEQVQEVVKIANQFKIPVTPCGARTSTWGAIQCKQGIVIDMCNMNKILKIDEENMTFTAQAGVPVQVMDKELRKQGYAYPTHPLLPAPVTIGSDIAKDTAGTYGAMFGHVGKKLVGLKVVLGNGEILQAGSSNVMQGVPRYLNSGMPDMTGLFIASEGALGVITEVSMQMIENPEFRVFMDYTFPPTPEGLENVIKAFREIKAKRLAYSIYHGDPCMVSWFFRQILEQDPDSWGTYPLEEQYHYSIITVTSNLSAKDCRIHEEEARNIMEKYGAEREADFFCRLIDSCAYKWNEFYRMSFGHRLPWLYIWADAPWFSTPEIYKRWLQVLDENDWPLQRSAYDTSFSLESCQPTGYIFFDASNAEEVQKAREVGKEFMRHMADVGVIPYRTGSIWRPYILDKLDPQYLKYIRAIKNLFDPNNIMNPGVSVF